MDFFSLQDSAKRQTRWLVGLFIIAVILIIACINLVFFLGVKFSFSDRYGYSLGDWLTTPYWLWISAATLLVIIISSLWRSYQLNQKPDAIARMVNATPVALNTQQPKEKQLVNLVEEISIASGVPIPKIYIMQQESNLNAFVSGIKLDQTCLVVTQGLLDHLNRQELQGVIAHEYSHIFNGDMNLNIRLIGVLAGILVIGQAGNHLMRATSRRRHSYSSGSRNSNGSAIVIVGLGLMLVGYIGLFFGRLIKAAVSRQREYLADASAVQFTRDRDGISGALSKIYQHGSRLSSAKSEEISHMCFGASVKVSFAGLLATHPPLLKRIHALNPQLARSLTRQTKGDNKQQAEAELTDAAPLNLSALTETDSSTAHVAQFAQSSMEIPQQSVASAKIIDSIGSLSEQNILQLRQNVLQIPQSLISLAKGEQQDAACYDMVVALLIANQQKSNQKSHTLNIQPFSISWDELAQITQQLAELNYTQQHYLLDLSLARIESYPQENNIQFVALLARLVSRDDDLSQTLLQTLSQTEFMFYACAAKRALPAASNKNSINQFSKIADSIVLFISLLYQCCWLSTSDKNTLFNKQMKSMGIIKGSKNKKIELIKDQLSVAELSQALNRIAQLNPLLKKSFIQICIDIVEQDQQINQKEYELLRLLGEYLGIPFPLASANNIS